MPHLSKHGQHYLSKELALPLHRIVKNGRDVACVQFLRNRKDWQVLGNTCLTQSLGIKQEEEKRKLLLKGYKMQQCLTSWIGSTVMSFTEIRYHFLSTEHLFFSTHTLLYDHSRVWGKTNNGATKRDSTLPGNHWGPQRASGCRWFPQRCGKFSDPSSLSPPRSPCGQRQKWWPFISYSTKFCAALSCNNKPYFTLLYFCP